MADSFGRAFKDPYGAGVAQHLRDPVVFHVAPAAKLLQGFICHLPEQLRREDFQRAIEVLGRAFG